MPSWKPRGTTTGALVLLTSLAPVAHGAADADQQATDSGEVRLSPVSVTATLNPISAFDYPGMVSVIGTEEIRDHQPSTPDDLLGRLPNVEFTGGPRRTGEVPSIRGFSGADVVVTIDGARQNFLSGHDGRFFLDPLLLREVEVLRGPASSLYGSGATGGVIALRTLRARDLLGPGDSAGVRVHGGYQDVNDETHAGLTAYGRPADDLGVLASVTTRNSGTIELGDGNELTDTDDDIVSGLLKGNWQAGEHSELEASFQRFDNDAREPNNPQGLGGDNQVDKDIRSDTARLRYSFSDPANPLLDLDALVYRTETSVDERRLDDSGLGPRGELLERNVDTTGVRLDNRSRGSLGDVGVTLTYGAEAYQDKQTGAADGADRAGVPDAEYDFYAAFAQAEIRWDQPAGVPGELLLVPGVRFDRFEASSEGADDLEDDEISPRLGITWKPTHSTMLFVNRANAFRAPTVGEIYPSGTHFQIPLGPPFGTISNRFVPNPDLKPQRTRTWEFGGGFEVSDLLASGDALNVKLTHFEVDGEDFIDTRVDQPAPFTDCNPGIPGDCDGTSRSVNVASAELSGQEVEAHYRVGRLRTSFGFSRIDGENTRTGEKLGVLTPRQFTLDARYLLPALDTTIGGRILRASDFDKVNDPSEERDAYTVVDLSLTWQPGGPALRGLSVRLGVDNVFDEAYSRTYTGAAEPGRNLKASVGYNVSW
ncbi:TonB-dependent receptor [Aquisalimonas lutea]|uniref:TonB-dependent receptor domain-containing protein n=1 Tax=Aquisalimonas lutea TaxID=1327750 RepID=UPI0025B4EB5B|nr:TonB-dependent receptor [Aquisalimonas lutea]MDN3518694.1 TonB-dependent receptor [Aquisalimonas lutea]